MITILKYLYYAFKVRKIYFVFKLKKFEVSFKKWTCFANHIVKCDEAYKEIKGRYPKYKDFLIRDVLILVHDRFLKLEINLNEKEKIAELVTKIIKRHFNDSNFKDEKNWKMAVELLKDFSAMFPETVREVLKFHFSKNIGHSLPDYERNLKNSFGRNDTKKLFRELRYLARKIKAKGKRKIIFINATFSGGGVAEMLQTAGPILKQLGIEIEWHIFYPYTPKYFDFTKGVHNAIQGNDTEFRSEDMMMWKRVAEDNVKIIRDIFQDDEVALVAWEDPQVVFGVEYGKFYQDRYELFVPMSWRCHIDITGITKKNKGALQVWGEILAQIQKLSTIDHALFQPFSIPEMKKHSTHIEVMRPGIDILKEKNFTISKEKCGKIIQEINNDLGTNIDINKPYLLVGARFDYWKNIPAAIYAFERIADKYQDINLIVFGNFAPDDPEGKDHNELIELIKQNSKHKDRIIIVANKNKELAALYKLGNLHYMPYIACSLREGFNLMTDECSMQETVPMTSDVGGLQRYKSTIYLKEFNVELSSISAKIERASDLYTIQNGEVQKGEYAFDLENSLYDKLDYLFSFRNESPEKYMELYNLAATEAKMMSLSQNLLVMLKNYLSIANQSLDEMDSSIETRF